MPPEEFTEPEPNVITSTEGFSVRVLGRTGMRYIEGRRSVWIDSEVLATPGAIMLNPSSMRAWQGPDTEPVTAGERERVVENVRRAFQVCGYELDVAEPFDWNSVPLRRPKPLDG